MMRLLIPACIVLVFSGCARNIVAPAPIPVSRVGQEVILNGTETPDGVLVDAGGYRFTNYLDFRPYDSLSITFTARRYAAGSGIVPFRVKISPAYYVPASLSATSQDFVLSVEIGSLVKPHAASLLFYADDPANPVIISNLGVVGWYTY